MMQSHIYIQYALYTGYNTNYISGLEPQCLRIRRYSDIPSIIIIGREECINQF